MPDPAIARRAGLLYLAVILCGLTAEFALRGSIAPGAEAAAMQQLRGAAALDAVMILCDVGLALTLYALFAPRDRALARAAMAFRLVQAAMLGAVLILQGATIVMIEHGHTAAAATARAAQTLGYDLGLIPFGAACLALAALFLRHGLPRLLGLALAGSGLVYLAGSFAALLAPALGTALQPAYLLPLLTEISFCIWLLAGAPARAADTEKGGPRPAQ